MRTSIGKFGALVVLWGAKISVHDNYNFFSVNVIKLKFLHFCATTYSRTVLLFAILAEIESIANAERCTLLHSQRAEILQSLHVSF